MRFSVATVCKATICSLREPLVLVSESLDDIMMLVASRAWNTSRSLPTGILSEFNFSDALEDVVDYASVYVSLHTSVAGV